MKRVVMENPSNNVRITTNKNFQRYWEDLGFVVITILVPLRKIAG